MNGDRRAFHRHSGELAGDGDCLIRFIPVVAIQGECQVVGDAVLAGGQRDVVLIHRVIVAAGSLSGGVLVGIAYGDGDGFVGGKLGLTVKRCGDPHCGCGGAFADRVLIVVGIGVGVYRNRKCRGCLVVIEDGDCHIVNFFACVIRAVGTDRVGDGGGLLVAGIVDGVVLGDHGHHLRRLPVDRGKH